MDMLIAKIKAAVPLSPADEGIIQKLFHKKIFQKDDRLLEAGEICRHLYFIEQGLVRYYLFHNGEEKTHYFNKENDWACEYQSFIPRVPTSVYIQAVEPTTAWTITYDDLQVFYHDLRYGERYGRLGIEQVFIDIIRQINSMYTDKPEVRYEKFLKAYSDVAQRIPQYHIASYVGVKPQSLSRIRKRILGKH